MNTLSQYFSKKPQADREAAKFDHGGKRRRLTQEQRTFIVEGHGKTSAKDIAAHVGCSIAHVYHTWTAHGFESARKSWTAEQIAEIRAAWESPTGEIAGALLKHGMSYSSARIYAHAGGWARRESRGFKLAWDQQLILVAAYKAGFPMTLLAEEFNLTRQGVFNTLVRHGSVPDRTDANTLREFARRRLNEFRAEQAQKLP